MHWTTTKRVRLPLFSERAGQRWKEPRRESAAKLDLFTGQKCPRTLADGRCVEVLVNALGRASTTLVSAITRAGGAQPHADSVPSRAFEQAAKRKRFHASPLQPGCARL